MTELGEKITIARKAKGLSQEKLAEDARISLRTLQRIEKGNTNPHGDTLQRISNALDIPIEELMEYGPMLNTGYIKAMHFAALTFILFPSGNIIIPLIMWLSRKNNIQNISFFAKNLLNFQITWSIIINLPILLIISQWMFKLNLFFQVPYISPFAFAGLYVLFFYLLNFVYIIVVGSLISDKIKNYFPVAIRFIR